MTKGVWYRMARNCSRARSPLPVSSITACSVYLDSPNAVRSQEPVCFELMGDIERRRVFVERSLLVYYERLDHASFQD